MKKKNIITVLLAFVWVAGQAQKHLHASIIQKNQPSKNQTHNKRLFVICKKIRVMLSTAETNAYFRHHDTFFNHSDEK